MPAQPPLQASSKETVTLPFEGTVAVIWGGTSLIQEPALPQTTRVRSSPRWLKYSLVYLPSVPSHAPLPELTALAPSMAPSDASFATPSARRARFSILRRSISIFLKAGRPNTILTLAAHGAGDAGVNERGRWCGQLLGLPQ